jgi:hypothetical protein
MNQIETVLPTRQNAVSARFHTEFDRDRFNISAYVRTDSHYKTKKGRAESVKLITCVIK